MKNPLKRWDVEPQLVDDRLVLDDVSVPLDQFNDIYIDFPAVETARTVFPSS